MSTQLTISLELITFMKWVLEHNKELLTQFMKEACDPELQAILAAVSDDQSISLPANDMYETLNTFIRHMERILHAQYSSGQVRNETKKRTRKHKKSCAGATRIKELPQETYVIESPTKRTLYQSLCDEESPHESTVH
jgi:hypothetical protein